ncbi:MAG: bactofilin family protein [Acetivibrionales bacterium]|jgi:cytoskeletal protein CcmA (bactofilin family)
MANFFGNMMDLNNDTAKPVKKSISDSTEKKETTTLNTTNGTTETPVNGTNNGTYNPFANTESKPMSINSDFLKKAYPEKKAFPDFLDAPKGAKGIIEPATYMTDGFVIKGNKVSVDITKPARIDSELHGDVTCHDLYVGKALVDGTITSDTTVVLSEESSVIGTIHAKNVHLYGDFRGNLTADENLVINESAHIQGKVIALGTVEIHPGAVLDGTAEFKMSEEEKKEPIEVEHVKEEPESESEPVHEPIDPFADKDQNPDSKEEPETEPVVAETKAETEESEPEEKPAKAKEKPDIAEKLSEEPQSDESDNEIPDIPDSFFSSEG